MINIKKVANTIFATLTIDIGPRDFDKKDNTFSFEMSDKGLSTIPNFLRLRNPKTQGIMDFEQYKVDRDASGEDIYGVWYKSKDKKYKLLIIND
jgi:hypothetical protein